MQQVRYLFNLKIKTKTVAGVSVMDFRWTTELVPGMGRAEKKEKPLYSLQSLETKRPRSPVSFCR